MTTPETLLQLRHTLHQYAERSGHEARTAEIVREFLRPYAPDEIVQGLGGHGLAVVFQGRMAGPTVLFRADLDALPITEAIQHPWHAQDTGTMHACGHDGHMTMVAGLGAEMGTMREFAGRMILLFQPEEETGQGARRVLDDPRFQPLWPDYAFALHNIPGLPLHTITTKAGPFAAASVGLIAHLKGQTSHAAHPEEGRSPAPAVAELLSAWTNLTEQTDDESRFALATIVGSQLGERAFGTSPGTAEVLATLRAYDDQRFNQLLLAAEAHAQHAARTHQLELKLERQEYFPATTNDSDCAAAIETCARQLDLRYEPLNTPFRWSEDFGHFTAAVPGAMFGLGSGKDQPPLHSADYDFPDELISTGVRLYKALAARYLVPHR